MNDQEPLLRMRIDPIKMGRFREVEALLDQRDDDEVWMALIQCAQMLRLRGSNRHELAARLRRLAREVQFPDD